MLRGYYDGSGTTPDAPFMTLTGVVASESVWTRFEKAWAAVLLEHGISYFHMPDAMALRGQFSAEYGWTDAKVNALILKFWQVLGRFRAIDGGRESNLMARSCTIVMDDYRRLLRCIPLKEAEAICVDYCVGGGIPKDIDSADELKPAEIILVFDRNEGFQRMVTRIWQDFKSRRAAGWPQQIRNIVKKDRELVEAGSHNTCPLQASDLLAWLTNRKQSTHNLERIAFWAATASIAVEHYEKVYDYSALVKRFADK
ncbi:MAG: DUF3800 domain-containing protein [Nitrospira sp.]|nr:DUF3800 domain-containing protein [Nitrospira sp.]